MKINILFLALTAIMGSACQRIDLTGDFEFIVSNKQEGKLVIKQSDKKNTDGAYLLSGFFYWNRKFQDNKERVYEVEGKFYPSKYMVIIDIGAGIQIEEFLVKDYTGYASDSGAIKGNVQIGLSRVPWMAVRIDK